MTHHPKSVGVIGFGVMGSHMAINIAKRGHTVYGYSRTPAKVEALSSEGIISSTPAELAERCRIVLLSLTDGSSVESVLFGTGDSPGLAPSLARGSLIIDTTTTAPRESIDYHHRCLSFGIEFVDVPVTGGDVGARNGTLTCMFGGTTETFARAEPILKCIGTKLFHVGEVGSGQRMKAVNQVAVALGIVAMTEAILFAENQEIDPAKAIEVLQGGAAGSWALSNYAPRVLQGDFKPGFSAAHMLKDLKIALSEVKSPLSLPATEAVTESFERLVERHGRVGNHALLKSYERK